MNPCMVSKYQHNIYTFYFKKIKAKTKKSHEDSQQKVSWIQGVKVKHLKNKK